MDAQQLAAAIIIARLNKPNIQKLRAFGVIARAKPEAISKQEARRPLLDRCGG